MLFAVATPIHIIEPVSAGTLSVGIGDEEKPRNPRKRGGQR